MTPKKSQNEIIQKKKKKTSCTKHWAKHLNVP